MRLIDADALIERMKKDPLFPLVERYGVTGVIEAEPTVDTEPVRHGRWRPVQIGRWHGYECTCCKVLGDVSFGINGKPAWKYCPECGARMDEEEI